ncbi:MAG: hypothetical protein R3E09_00175 [Novosphingobium sp.]
MGFFNNPNQLGYYSVIIVCIVTVFMLNRSINFLDFSVVYMACAGLAILSLSKAAIFSVLVVPIIFVAERMYDHRNNLSAIAGMGVAGLILVGILGIDLGIIDISDLVVYDRIIDMRSEQDTSLAVRGYSVFFEADVIEMIFGIGSYESAVRHNYAEIHSTFMAPITYYGLVGGGLFLAFILQWVWRAKRAFGWWGGGMVCLPILLYGVTHDGGRASLLWVLVALIFAISERRGFSRIQRDEPKPCPELGYGRA